jgi:hypothetical protein
MDKDFLTKTLKSMYLNNPNKEAIIIELKGSIEELKQLLAQNKKDTFLKKSFEEQISFQKELLKLAKKL